MSKSVVSLPTTYFQFLLKGGNAFVNPKNLLEDLSAEAAASKLEGSAHSIAVIVAHLDYWQNWFYAGALGNLEPYPKHNDSTFPPVSATQWSEIRDHFLTGLEAIKTLCDDADLLQRSFANGQETAAGHSERSVAETMLYTVALHNAHHYGQIITLRQMMKLWPPKAGSMTW